MGKVTPAVTDTFVDPSHGFPSPSPGRGTFLFSGQEPLDPLQVLLVFPEEPGVSNLRIITHSGEGIQANVDPNGTVLGRGGLNVYLAGESDQPFPGAGPTNATGFNSTLYRPMQNNLDIADLREVEGISLDLESRLRIAEAVISTPAPEPWVARILAVLDPSEEGFEGQVQPDGYILQDLAVDTAQAGTFRLEFGERLLLTIQAQGFFSLLIGCLALFKEVIIQPTALLKSLLHESLLGLGGSEPVLEGLTHVSSIAQSWEVGLRG